MQKVVEYQVVRATLTNVQRQVNDEIAKGWVPSGPLLTFEGNLLQVMVKFDQA